MLGKQMTCLQAAKRTSASFGFFFYNAIVYAPAKSPNKAAIVLNAFLDGKSSCTEGKKKVSV